MGCYDRMNRCKACVLKADGVFGRDRQRTIVSSGHSDGTTVMTGIRRHPRVWEELGKMCRAIDAIDSQSIAIDSLVDRTFLIEVFFISTAQMFLRAVHHGHLRPKFRSNTCVTKGVLCPKKSIPSIKSSTVP